jgi:hypothetical protein
MKKLGAERLLGSRRRQGYVGQAEHEKNPAYVKLNRIMKYFTIEPEVAGGLGQNTILDSTIHPPRVIKLHYQFNGWLGDPILETVATFIVTSSIKNKIETSAATGVQFEAVEISKSGEFEDFFPNRKLPGFLWIQITGNAGKDDFGLSSTHRLVVSQRILEILKAEGMSHCEITEYKI